MDIEGREAGIEELGCKVDKKKTLDKCREVKDQ